MNVKLNQAINLIFLVLIIFSLFTTNPILSIAGIGVLYLIIKIVWIAYAPSVFLYCLIYQWLQAYTRVWQANINQYTLNDFAKSNSAETAIWVSLAGVVLSAITIRLCLRNFQFYFEQIIISLNQISIYKLASVWSVFFALTPVLNYLRIGGLSQIIFPLFSIKWVLFCLLYLTTVFLKKDQKIFYSIFLLEFILGFTGYFSGFKTVIIYAIIISSSTVKEVSTKTVYWGLLTLIFLVPLALFWTATKGNYRSFVSNGQKSQAVVVSKSKALGYLGDELKSFNSNTGLASIDPFLSRLQYTQMCQMAMDYVPEKVPYENGKLWMAAINHILTPRILYPDKPPLDDSEIASKYTGRRWAGAKEGSSIGIGYFAESYVDFGFIGMFVPIILLAIIVGLMYSYYITRNSKYWIIEFYAAIPMLIEYDKIETSSAKILGGFVMGFIVYSLIIRKFIFPVIWKNIVKHKK